MLWASLLFGAVTWSSAGASPQPEFVGAERCKLCHRQVYESWLATAHARPDLLPPDSDASCRSCHVTEAISGLLGVQCESCHGPGSAYSPAEVMIDRDKALLAGPRDPRRDRVPEVPRRRAAGTPGGLLHARERGRPFDDPSDDAAVSAPPSFVVPESARYECLRCGDSCRGWRIALGPGESDRIQALDWSGRAEELVGARVVRGRGKRAALAQRPDGSCVFLGDRQQCVIHEHFGAAAKPLVCRLYPFGFLPVGDRIAVDVSFACRAVANDHGPLVRERIPEWASLLGDSEPGPPSHRFSKKYVVEPALLWELEFRLVALLEDESRSLLERVRAVSEYVRLALTADPSTPAAAKLREVMAEALPRQLRERPLDAAMDDTQRAVFHHLLFLHLNPTPPELEPSSGRARKREVARRVEAADGYRSGVARPWLANEPLEVTFDDVAAVGPGCLLEKEGASRVSRFLVAKIVGQAFLREGERTLAFVKAVPRLLVFAPMVAWTARALAAARGSSAVGLEDVRDAIRRLDRSFGQVALSTLPSKQRKAWAFVLGETELATCAAAELLGGANGGGA